MEKITRYLTICLLLFSSLLMCADAQTKNPKVQQALENAYAKGEFSGVILASKGDEILYKGAIGDANREWKIPNRTTTKFRICSVTKQFTATLVMQLVESGKVNLDAKVSDYLPEFRKDTASKITIRNLLLSASGLPVFPDDFYVDENAKMTDANFVINKYLQGDLLFESGEKFNYNNGDFVTLGAIIEKVSGKSYEQNLREKILEPLKMKNTGLLRDDGVIENMASGYTFKNGRFMKEGLVQIQNFGSSGAMYSTAEDLLLWDKALLSNRILSKKFTDEMFTPSAKLGFVGLGSWSYKLKLGGVSKTIVERQGYINGFCALNIIVPEDNISLIFLSNAETQTLFRTYASQGFSFEVLKLLTDK
ncbi:MAG: serine hydrolase [Pyrinomonadaceae bacterium]|nr:serine hydrolase [Pyrinomonadaceae bacterium]